MSISTTSVTDETAKLPDYLIDARERYRAATIVDARSTEHDIAKSNALQDAEIGLADAIKRYGDERDAEIKKFKALVLRAVDSNTTPDGECHVCWAPPDKPHDETCWVGEALSVEDSVIASADLLPK